MRFLIAGLFLLFLAGCGSRAVAGAADAAVDAGGQGGDGGEASCGAKPTMPNLPECRAECGYLCGEQCPDICGAGGCWSCSDTGWKQVAVDCVTNCP